MDRTLRCRLALLFCILGLPSAACAVTVTGMPVPQLASFDNAMTGFMTAYGIDSGVLAVSRNGVIVYQRGFGSKSAPGQTIGMPENTPMRIASLTKPLTAAAIRHLIANGVISGGQHVFNLGQPGGGILNITPWNGLGAGIGGVDARSITVDNLLKHRGGWSDAGVGGDPVFRTVEIANALGVQSPAGRQHIAEWLLHKPLTYTPGTLGCLDAGNNPTFCYFNAGYMLLGMIVEQVTPMTCEQYVRANVLTPSMWVPATELFPGRSFAVNQSPREPVYQSTSFATNVFNPGGPQVLYPYGGWDHESFVGFGNVVMSAAPMAVYLNNYEVWYDNIGLPLNGSPPSGGAHAGGLDGTSTMAAPRTDGINIVVFFAKAGGTPDACNHLACSMAATINTIINNGGFSWPTWGVDGFWVDFQFGGLNYYGAYDHPFSTMNAMVNFVADGSKLHFKPGSQLWTGTINRKLRFDAPFGAARIGE